MSPIRQFERTYLAIRSRLVTGAWRPGLKLVTPRIAVELGVSHSPVRECLNHLAGERMVDFWPSLGFFVPQHDETGLRELFDCHHWLLQAIVAGYEDAEPWPDCTEGDHPERAAALFGEIARRSRNPVLAEMVRGLGDRLHVYWRLDPQILPRADEDLKSLADAFAAGMKAVVLRDLLSHHHATRTLLAARYVELRTGHASGAR